MRIQYYHSKFQLKNIKEDLPLTNESIIHNDYLDVNGNPTDGNKGKLTIDIKPPVIPTADQITVRNIIAKIQSNQSLNNVEERDFRKLYHIMGIR